MAIDQGFQLEIKGVEELLTKFDYIDRRVNDGAVKVLREGAKVTQDAIEENTPIGPYSPPKHGAHAITRVIIGRTKMTDGEKSVLIGYAPEHAWYMYFVEEGTYSKGNPKGISPRKHVQKAHAGSVGAVEAVMSQGITDLINSL